MGASVPNGKLFNTPFGVSGDKATIPEATQPNGAVSYQQGFGPDYERDPATDPLAKRVPRDETNELYYQVTNTIRWLQLYGLPEWYAQDDTGQPVSYPIAARVRHNNTNWVSVAANNTQTPGASGASNWVAEQVFNLALLEATAAQAQAQTAADRIITPRRLGDVTSTLTRRGLVELATDAETIAGTDAERAVTPASLTARSSTTARTGLVELATNAETAAGTDTVRAVTPAGAASVYPPQSRQIATGSGLSGGGDLSANRTLSVDGTVVRTTGAQTIAGVKTFSDTIAGQAITSFGVPVAGVYTGTAIANTNYPVGTAVLVRTLTVVDLNGQVNIRAEGDSFRQDGGGTQLTGVWRSRGQSFNLQSAQAPDPNQRLMICERVS